MTSVSELKLMRFDLFGRVLSRFLAENVLPRLGILYGILYPHQAHANDCGNSEVGLNDDPINSVT
jgi:hypothetical protein